MFFVLRKWHPKDAPSLSKNANNRLISDNLRDGFPYPYTTKDAVDFISDCVKNDEKKQILRAIDIQGNAVGGIGVFIQDNVHRVTAEMGYWLGEDYWGQGIMSSAIRQMCSVVFSYYDVVRIYAQPFETNIGSRKALEKAGFKLEGILERSAIKNGIIIDTCMYAKLK